MVQLREKLEQAFALLHCGLPRATRQRVIVTRPHSHDAVKAFGALGALGALVPPKSKQTSSIRFTVTGLAWASPRVPLRARSFGPA
jgi:hypothetical protein